MKKRFFVLVVFGLSGCVSMLSHISYTDGETREHAQKIAVMDLCAERKLTSTTDVEDFKSAFVQLLTVAVYNKDVFAEGYAKEREWLNAGTAKSFLDNCKKFEAEIKTATTAITQRYVQISSERRRDAVSMFAGLASYQAPAYGASSYVAPSTNIRPSFGVQQPRTSHYLVNTPGGFKHCSITSGMVMCN